MLTVKELLDLDLGEAKRMDYDTGKVMEKFGVSQKVGQKVEKNFTDAAIADKPVFFAEIINTQKLTDYQLCQKIVDSGVGEHYKYRANDKKLDDKLCEVTKFKLTDEGYIIKKKYPQLDQVEVMAFAEADQEKFAHVPEVFELILSQK